MSKPKKVKLKSLFIKEDYKNFINSFKLDEDLNELFKKIKIKKYIDCIEIGDGKTKNELTSDEKDIVQNTLYFLVFIAVHIHLKGIGNVFKENEKNLLKEKWNNYMKNPGSQSCENYGNYLISKKIIFQDWNDVVQFEKSSRNTHESITHNCKNNRYIIKYKENGFQFRICLCIINEEKIKILAFNKKKDRKI